MFKLSSTQDFVEKSAAKSATDPAPQTRGLDTCAGSVGDIDQTTSADIQRQLVERIGGDRFNMWFDGAQNFQSVIPLKQLSASRRTVHSLASAFKTRWDVIFA